MGRSATLCIGEVAVQIEELSEASGESLRLCRLSLRMIRLGSFSIEFVEDEVMFAMSWAAERAAERVKRNHDRQRDGK